MIKVSITGMMVSLITDLRFPSPGQQGHGARIIQEAEKNLKTTPGSDCALNALAIDEPLEYVRLYLDGTMQMWVDAEDSLEL